MESVYSICFYGGLVLTILLFIATVASFFLLKIPKVIGELTGRSAKRSVDEMKKGGASTSAVSRKEQAKYYNQGTGKITVRDTVSEEKRKENHDDTTNLLSSNMKTMRKGEYDPNATEVLGARYTEEESEATEILSADYDNDGEATDVLTSSDDYEGDTTDVLTSNDDYDEGDTTDVLTSNDDYDEGDTTDVLTSDDNYDDGDTTDVLTSEVEDDEPATDVLSAKAEDDEPATDVLSAGDDDLATDVLRMVDDEDSTSVLSQNTDATSVLSVAKSSTLLNSKVKVLYNVLLIHTDEKL